MYHTNNIPLKRNRLSCTLKAYLKSYSTYMCKLIFGTNIRKNASSLPIII